MRMPQAIKALAAVAQDTRLGFIGCWCSVGQKAFRRA